jgi:hypothetical protein
MFNYKYLFIIRCKVNNNFTPEHIPSFETNNTVGYFVKSFDDIIDIIKEIFLVWRYKYHSDKSEYIRNKNVEYMHEIIQQVKDLKYFPYVDFNINGGHEPKDNINCWFKVYPMRDEFRDLLDLFYKKNKPELYNNKNHSHRFISYLVYKDNNPNRLKIHFTQNHEYLTKGINQIFLITNKTYDYKFYAFHFQRLGLTIKKPDNFIKLLKSNMSFVLTLEDFITDNNLLYVNIYCFTPINEEKTNIRDILYELKMSKIKSSL